MNNPVIPVIIIFLLASCSSERKYEKEDEPEGDNSCIVNGHFLNGGNKLLYLEKITMDSFIPLDTIRISGDGSFISDFLFSYPSFLALRNESRDYIILFPKDSDTIFITANYSDFSSYNISGNTDSEAIAKLHKKTRDFLENMKIIAGITKDSIESQNFTAVKLELNILYDSIYREFRKFSIEFIKENKHSPVSLLALHNNIGQGYFVFNLQNDFDIFLEVDSVLYPLYPDFLPVRTIHDQINIIKTRQMSVTAGSKPAKGSMAPEISLPDTAGNIHSLSSLRDKIVLVDFWGSWCPPCRRNNSELLAIYKKWNDKGFRVFQVALEKDQEQWTEAIKKDRLPWINVSDLEFWNSPVAAKYGINAIPASFLIDRQGKIIDINLVSSELEEILTTILNN